MFECEELAEGDVLMGTVRKGSANGHGKGSILQLINCDVNGVVHIR